MKRISALFLLLTVSGALAADYLPAGQPDAVALLAPPPLANSAEQAADLAEVRSVSTSISPREMEVAKAEGSFSVFIFRAAIGDVFQQGKLPQTEEFLRKVRSDTGTEINAAKNYWKRPRPYIVDPSLAPGKKDKSFSYPSGHSTGSTVLGLVLSDLFPERHDAIMAESRLIGWHRVEIARHYPTDIYAGRVFAQAIVREMKKSPEFQKDFAAAKAEISALPHTQNP